MDITAKAGIIQGLRNEMGDRRSIFELENPDGRFIPERIAFEYYTPEEKEAIRRKYAKDDAKIEEQKQKILADKKFSEKIESVLKIRESRKESRFWTK